MFVVVAPEHSLTLHTAIIVQEAVFLKSAFCICSQMLQMSASLGWSRFALMMNLMTSPLQSDQFGDDVTNRQVSFCGRISNLNHDCDSVRLTVRVVCAHLQKHLLCQPRHLSSAVDEHFFINESFTQMRQDSSSLLSVSCMQINCVCICRLLTTLKRFPSNVSVSVMSGNLFDELLHPSLNQVSVYNSIECSLVSSALVSFTLLETVPF